MYAHMYEGLKNKNYNPKPKQVQGWMVWGLVFRGWVSYRICTRGHRVSVGCARGKLTLTKTEKWRPQAMSTGCCEGPGPCKAAPGRSTDMPQMLLSFTHLRSNFFKKNLSSNCHHKLKKRHYKRGLQGGALGCPLSVWAQPSSGRQIA